MTVVAHLWHSFSDSATVTIISFVCAVTLRSERCQDLDPGFFLLPGDELKTRCVWDATGSTNTTYGGFASNEEMCIQ